MSLYTELVTFKTREDIKKDGFISIVNSLEKNFHSKQKGFLDTELLYDEKQNRWIMIQHWESVELLKAASERMFQDIQAQAFVESIIPETVDMVITPQIQVWK